MIAVGLLGCSCKPYNWMLKMDQLHPRWSSSSRAVFSGLMLIFRGVTAKTGILWGSQCDDCCLLVLVSAAQTSGPWPLDLAGKKWLMILLWWNVCLSGFEFITILKIWRYNSETCWNHTSHHSSQALKPRSSSVVTALVIRTVICFGSFVLA